MKKLQKIFGVFAVALFLMSVAPNSVYTSENFEQNNFQNQSESKVVKVNCEDLAVLVFDAAMLDGYSIEEAYDAAIAVGVMCTTLNYISSLP